MTKVKFFWFIFKTLLIHLTPNTDRILQILSPNPQISRIFRLWNLETLVFCAKIFKSRRITSYAGVYLWLHASQKVLSFYDWELCAYLTSFKITKTPKRGWCHHLAKCQIFKDMTFPPFSLVAGGVRFKSFPLSLCLAFSLPSLPLIIQDHTTVPT